MRRNSSSPHKTRAAASGCVWGETSSPTETGAVIRLMGESACVSQISVVGAHPCTRRYVRGKRVSVVAQVSATAPRSHGSHGRSRSVRTRAGKRTSKTTASAIADIRSARVSRRTFSTRRRRDAASNSSPESRSVTSPGHGDVRTNANRSFQNVTSGRSIPTIVPPAPRRKIQSPGRHRAKQSER